MPEARKARAVGVNHVALEVGDLDEALAFYGRLFDFELRGRTDTAAFIDLGDQFLALQKGRRQPADDGRHFGLVVDDRDAVRDALVAAGIELLPGPFLDFLDPWGNRIEIVGYESIQFTKAPSRAAGHGAGPSGEEREGGPGTDGQGHGAGLNEHREQQSIRRRVRVTGFDPTAILRQLRPTHYVRTFGLVADVRKSGRESAIPRSRPCCSTAFAMGWEAGTAIAWLLRPEESSEEIP